MFAPSLLVKKFRESDLLKNVGITFGETFITKGMNFLVILILARALGPEDYGKYSFIFVTVALLAALFDFGMENTAVRFSARDKEIKNTLFGMYALIKIITLALLSLLLLLAGPLLFQWFNKAEMTPYLPFLVAGLIGESLYLVNDTYLQAMKRFRMRAALNIARYGTLLGYILCLLYLNQLTLHLTFYMSLVPVIFSSLFLPKYIVFIHDFLSKKLQPGMLKEIRHYQGWMLTYSVANNLIGRVDIFMLAIWVGFEALGLYNTAFQLCAVVSFIPFVIGKVLLPTLAESDTRYVFQTTDRLVQGIVRVALIGLLVIPLAYWVLPLLLGSAYAAVVPVWQILFVAFLFGFIGMPYEQALYSLGEPKILTWSRYLQLLAVTILHALTIPVWGIYAAAVNTLIGRFLYFIFLRKHYLREKTLWQGAVKNPFVEARIW